MFSLASTYPFNCQLPHKSEDRYQGPFFMLKEQQSLTKTEIVTQLQTAIAAIGLDQTVFSGHSFQSGMATAVSQAGLSDPII